MTERKRQTPVLSFMRMVSNRPSLPVRTGIPYSKMPPIPEESIIPTSISLCNWLGPPMPEATFL